MYDYLYASACSAHLSRSSSLDCSENSASITAISFSKSPNVLALVVVVARVRCTCAEEEEEEGEVEGKVEGEVEGECFAEELGGLDVLVVPTPMSSCRSVSSLSSSL